MYVCFVGILGIRQNYTLGQINVPTKGSQKITGII